jgi:acyl-CoA hydrolase/GNAT superfamily N-acetyltransferase
VWKDQYANRRRRPDDIIGLICPGNKVYIETGCSEPRFLVEQLILSNKKLSDVEIYTSIPLSGFSDFGGKFGSRFRIKSFFISPSISSAFSEGNADHMPLSTAGLTNLILKKYIRINIAIIQLGTPDDRGFMSLGVTVDITRTIIENADIVIAQVNSRVPRTFGDGFIHVSRVHHIVEHDEPLVEFPQEDPDPETIMVGENIASLIEDGATIQVGFGRIPDAALLALRGKKDIGVHSEIITDSICDLVDRGVITNDRKPVDRGKIIASMCLGTGRIFDFVHDNPSVELRRPTYTSNPQVFHAIDNLVAINGAVEIDLTGQSCVGMSEHRDYFGVLSHAEFNRAAMFTPRGKGIIALRSTSRDGSLSRIVPEFTDSRIGIITTQSDIHFVVTEYGCVDLFGKSIRDRALSLISIAHPKFRTWLLEEAKRLNYVYQDQSIPPEYALYPVRYEREKTFGGEKMDIRPIKITDERGIQDLFYAMSQDDKFYRFLRHVSVLHHQQAQPLVSADYRNSMALVVTQSENRDGTILAVSHFARELQPERENECEFAVIVHPAWQNKGIGSYLFTSLLAIARENGFIRMNAYVWEDNAQMLKVFEKAGLPSSKSLAEHVYTIQMDISSAT